MRKKIISMYYDKEIEGDYSTGLVLVLENGTTLRHQSTDSLMAFEPFIDESSKRCPYGDCWEVKYKECPFHGITNQSTNK